MATNNQALPPQSALARAYLDSVCAQPDDDAPRLAYADGLDGQGDHARAEFIRVQCQLARLDPGDPDRPPLAEAERALLRLHEAEWRAGLPALADIVWGRFARGFVAAVQAATIPVILRRADQIFALQPVQELRLLAARDADRLFLDPVAARLRTLDLTAAGVSDRVVVRLTVSPFLQRLAGLDLSGNRIRGLALNLLASAPQLPGLRRLALRGCGITAADLRRLLKEPVVLPGLRALDLADNEFGDPGARALVECPFLTGLRALGLERNNFTPRLREALLRRFPFVEL